MQLNHKLEKNTGILYVDQCIVCVKNHNNIINVYSNEKSLKKILSIQVASTTNQVDAYNKKIYYFENRNTIFISFDGRHKLVENDVFYYAVNSNYKAYTKLYNKTTIVFEFSEDIIEITKLQNSGPRLFLEEIFIQVENRKRNYIAAFDLLEKGNCLWHHKFSDLIQADDAYLNSELIEVGGKLYFTLNSQKGGDPGIICLDVQSGELIRHFAGTFFGVFKDNDFVFSTRYQNILCKIDSRTNEIETWDVGQLLKENNFKSINDHRCAAQDGKFYFTQTFGDHNAKLGILNFDTKIMDYNYDFEVSNGAIGSIKPGKDRIFVHTQDHTLHIFEE